MLGKETHGAPALLHSIFNLVCGISTRSEDAITLDFHQIQETSSVGVAILQTAAEEHVVVHEFSNTLVAVERMEAPPTM